MEKRNLIWLASYPKSGNTWFRAFLSALLDDQQDLDINGLKTRGIFSSREIFNACTDLDSRYLYDTEIKQMLPEVYSFFSNESEKPHYIKVHDAYTFNHDRNAIIPERPTKCAVYILRNPLDIVASFANHIGSSVEKAIRIMNNPAGCLACQENNLNVGQQLRQLLLSWSLHVESWTTRPAFPVLVIRYEDMLSNPFECFTTASEFMDIEATPEKIKKAIEATHFKKLQQKEMEKGFHEKQPKSKAFFRTGTSGNWKNELTREQAQSVLDNHGHIMQQYGYDVRIDDAYHN